MLNKISISYEVLFLLCISSQIASGLACYVRKYKLNFRNRELLDKRQHFPTGAESTCLEGRTAGGKSPCGSTFSDHPMDNLTSQPQKNEIRRISKRILRLADKIPYSMHHKRDFLLHADFLWLRKRHLKRCLFLFGTPGNSQAVRSIIWC